MSKKESTYRQVLLNKASGSLGDDYEMVVWLPESLAVEGKLIHVKGEGKYDILHADDRPWTVKHVWPHVVTFEDLSNQRDAQKQRESRVR